MAKTPEEERRRPAVTLPPDTLSSTFGYLDLGDVPSAARVARDWSQILRSMGDKETCSSRNGIGGIGQDTPGREPAGLWLSLIRKHHPAVERITEMLSAGCGEGAVVKEPPVKKHRGDDSGGASATIVRLPAIPAPSKNWRRQFQRAHMLSRRSGSESKIKKPKHDPKRKPKPLSAYSFELELILYQGTKEVSQYGHHSWPSGRTQVGTVSRVYDNVSFLGDESANDDTHLRFVYKDGGDLSKYEFTSFDIRIFIVDRSTRKRAKLYEGGYSDATCFALIMTLLRISPVQSSTISAIRLAFAPMSRCCALAALQRSIETSGIDTSVTLHLSTRSKVGIFSTKKHHSIQQMCVAVALIGGASGTWK